MCYSSYIILVPLCLDTHLSRLPCSGQWCLGSNSPRNLFSGKKGSLGIPVKIIVIHLKKNSNLSPSWNSDIKTSLYRSIQYIHSISVNITPHLSSPTVFTVKKGFISTPLINIFCSGSGSLILLLLASTGIELFLLSGLHTFRILYHNHMLWKTEYDWLTGYKHSGNSVLTGGAQQFWPCVLYVWQKGAFTYIFPNPNLLTNDTHY